MKVKIETDLSLSNSVKQYYNLRGKVSEKLLLSEIDNAFDKETRDKAKDEISKDKVK